MADFDIEKIVLISFLSIARALLFFQPWIWLVSDFLLGQHVNAITLRNAKKLPDPTSTGVGVINQPKSKRDETPKYLEKKFEKEVEKHTSKLFSDNPPPYNLPIPFLQRLQKHKLDG